MSTDNPFRQYSLDAIREDVRHPRAAADDYTPSDSENPDAFVVVYDPEEIKLLAAAGLLWFHVIGQPEWTERYLFDLPTLWGQCRHGECIVGVQVEY